MEAKVINYVAEPTAAKFHASTKTVRGLRGPIGSSKSVPCVNELRALMQQQAPNSEGVRLSRGIIVRNTVPQLMTTTLNTFKTWFPNQICTITLAPFVRARVKYPMADGTRVECEIYFLSLDKDEDVDKITSLEITFAYVNEARDMPYSVIGAIRERLGRYPSVNDGYSDTKTYKGPRNPDGTYNPCTRMALVMDTNSPDEEHWWYQLAEEGCLREAQSHLDKKRIAEEFEFFAAPPPLIKQFDGSYARNPNAENIANLPGGYAYYEKQLAGKPEDVINTMILGNYGLVKTGKPVFPEYNDALHCPAQIIPVDPTLPIGLGWDGGLTPACVFTQMSSVGQVRTIASLSAESMDVFRFARDVVKPFFLRNFADIEVHHSYCDPAGNSRGEGIGVSAIAILNDDWDYGDTKWCLDLPFITEAAPTNDITKRLSAVRMPMMRLVGAGEPGYLISKACKKLRKAKMGGYHYAERKNGELRDKPEKNQYSHESDAEEYSLLGWMGYQREDDFVEVPTYRQDEVSPMGY